MKSETKIMFIVLACTIVLLVGGVFFLSAKQPQTNTDTSGQIVYQIDYSKGEKIGTDSAKVKLVEFGDLQCPACKAYEPTVEQIRQQYQNNPNFQLIWRNFPLYPVPHQFAKMAAEAAMEANAEGKFWQLHDLIYQNQDSWAAKPDPTQDFVDMANQVGVDGNKVRDAIKNNTYDAIIQADVNEGNKLQVDATPTFYLNGKKLILVNLSDLVSDVDNALK